MSFFDLLLWQLGQWPTKSNNWQEGSDHDGFNCWKRQKCSKALNKHLNVDRLSRLRGRRTILCVGVEGRELRLRLRNYLLPVHALLQALKHALLSDSLNVPPAKRNSEAPSPRRIELGRFILCNRCFYLFLLFSSSSSFAWRFRKTPSSSGWRVKRKDKWTSMF